MAVLAVVYAARDVHPPVLAPGLLVGVMLQYQLVVVGILLGIAEQQSCCLFISAVCKGPMRLGDGDVGRLAQHVLRVTYAFYKRIKFRTAKSATYEYGQTELLSCGLERVLSQILHSHNVMLKWRVR